MRARRLRGRKEGNATALHSMFATSHSRKEKEGGRCGGTDLSSGKTRRRKEELHETDSRDLFAVVRRGKRNQSRKSGHSFVHSDRMERKKEGGRVLQPSKAPS